MNGTALLVLLLTTIVLSLAGCAPTALTGLLGPAAHSGVFVPLWAGVSTVAAQPPTDGSAESAIKLVIERGNAQQVEAIASRDSSVMRDTSTERYYQELVLVNQELIDNGVVSIELVAIEWGPITLTGDTARATSFETWKTTLADGTSSQSRRERNEYRLVQQDGGWKIQSDDHPDQNIPLNPRGFPIV
ncbi:MAG: hypothetical protein HW416_1690 [Chloroflexi bacterium]|nr:hypothetical protein [Chloroflexota bacterium]